MSVKLYFGKQKSRVSYTFLDALSAPISDVPGQRFGICMWCGPRCYSKEFCLSLQGEVGSSNSALTGCWWTLQSLDAVFIHFSSCSQRSIWPPTLSFSVLGQKSCISEEFNLCPSQGSGGLKKPVCPLTTYSVKQLKRGEETPPPTSPLSIPHSLQLRPGVQIKGCVGSHRQQSGSEAAGLVEWEAGDACGMTFQTPRLVV